ncbi:S-layer homology domain-containing protein [uncultured Dysosmobacter sp.]|uniref:S-layer homology domain-containing protein n=1 Tax=uncultured Dysosmobacter sp. TaxID=2591384 RepID=UPI00262AE4B8|nr:S-layer homology domain-containing protein [uncultured Dysosmobacter sp.]
MKKILVFVLTFVLVLNLAVPMLADGEDAADAADTLHDLGLFLGSGTADDGTPIFNLDQQATRIEALVMLIRLLGREKEALSCNYEHPFTDVPEWANGYVALANHDHIANGKPDNKFAPNDNITPKEFLTFVLRALGYSDNAEGEVDFTFQDSEDFAVEVGLVPEASDTDIVLRGDLAEISLTALSLETKGTDTTLIQSLVGSGAVALDPARDAGFTVEPPKDGEIVSIAYDNDGQSVLASDFLKAFPNSFAIGRTSDFIDRVEWIASNTGHTKEEIEIITIAEKSYFRQFIYGEKANKSIYINVEPENSPDDYYYSPYYVFDDNLNVIAMFNPDNPSYTDDTINFVRKFIDCSELFEEVKATTSSQMASRDQYVVMVDVNDPQGDGWDDGGGMAYTYPVYLDGEPMSLDYYVVCDLIRKDAEGWSEDEIYSKLYDFEWDVVYSPEIYRYADNPDVILDRYFGELNDSTYKKSGKTYYGLYCYEHLFDQSDEYVCLVAVYDEPYHMVGYTLI